MVKNKISSITISIPAYNDENTLKDVVEKSVSTVKKITDDYQILIIDDGSKDNTLKVAQQLKEKNNRITIIHHKENEGFGKTILEVFKIPEKEWIFFIPGDGQVPPEELEKFIQKVDSYDFIIGRRVNRADSLSRKINSYIYNFIVSIVSGRRVHDVNSSVLLNKRISEDISFTCKSAFIHAELYLEAVRKNAKICEIDINHKRREYGREGGNKFSVIFHTFFDLVRYIFMRKL